MSSLDETDVEGSSRTIGNGVPRALWHASWFAVLALGTLCFVPLVLLTSVATTYVGAGGTIKVDVDWIAMGTVSVAAAALAAGWAGFLRGARAVRDAPSALARRASTLR